MVIRLNPQFPVVWRTPDSIQIGIDRPITVVDHVSTALERVVNLLRVGLPRASIAMMSREVGATDAELERLLLALRPALILTGDDRPLAPDFRSEPHDTTDVPPRTLVCIDGVGPTADGIARSVVGLGIPVLQAAPFDPLSSGNNAGAGNNAGHSRLPHHHAASQSEHPSAVSTNAVAVVIGNYALDPRRHGRWLRRDVPHLPVLFGDSDVHIGPFVEPGVGPCLYCVELHHIDSDPAWPAIAYQLSDRLAPTETARISMDVSTLVAGIVADRVETGASEFATVSLTLDAATGQLTRRAHLPHERCGCQALSEIATALAGHADPGPMRTN
jgi:bacteriocin biosynthesis cyclodehydratase domain-containing protein